MRRFVMAIVATASGMAASPATAQYYPRWEPSRDHYGYDRSWVSPRGLQNRIHNVLRSLDGVRPGHRHELRREAIQLDRRLGYAAHNGLSRREHHDFDVRIGYLERAMGRASFNRGHRYDGRDRDYYEDRGRRGHRDRRDRDDD